MPQYERRARHGGVAVGGATARPGTFAPVVVGHGLEQRYGSPAGAAAYRTKYDGSWARRWSARREAALLRWALATAGTEGVALDAPCGAGRMTPVLLERAHRVTAVDLSMERWSGDRRVLFLLVDEYLKYAATRVRLAIGGIDGLSELLASISG